MDGLLGDAQRKNSWQLAQTAGNATPYGFQHLLGRGRAVWSANAARDALYAYVAFAPPGCNPETLVAVAGRCWPIEHTFKVAKQRQDWTTTRCAAPSADTGT